MKGDACCNGYGINPYTVKFLKIRTPEKFAVIILKFEQRPKDVDRIANRVDPDQTTSLGAV